MLHNALFLTNEEILCAPLGPYTACLCILERQPGGILPLLLQVCQVIIHAHKVAPEFARGLEDRQLVRLRPAQPPTLEQHLLLC